MVIMPLSNIPEAMSMASALAPTSLTPSSKERAPLKIRAVISPTLNPAVAMQFYKLQDTIISRYSN
jgi:hypothetical protein